MDFSRVEADDDAFAAGIGVDVLHAGNFAQRVPKFAHALVAIFAFGCDFDRFDDRLIAVLLGSALSSWRPQALSAQSGPPDNTRIERLFGRR